MLQLNYLIWTAMDNWIMMKLSECWIKDKCLAKAKKMNLRKQLGLELRKEFRGSEILSKSEDYFFISKTILINRTIT